PPRVDREQLGGGVADLLGGLALGLVPLAGAELVERRLFGADARVARDQVQLRDRDVERRLVGVLELEKLARLLVGAAERERRQSEVAADAVVDVDDRVADRELGEILDQR